LSARHFKTTRPAGVVMMVGPVGYEVAILADFLPLARLYYEGIMEAAVTSIPIYQVEWPDSAGHYSDHPRYHATTQQRP
jgi:hypothetical protein